MMQLNNKYQVQNTCWVFIYMHFAFKYKIRRHLCTAPVVAVNTYLLYNYLHVAYTHYIFPTKSSN